MRVSSSSDSPVMLVDNHSGQLSLPRTCTLNARYELKRLRAFAFSLILIAAQNVARELSMSEAIHCTRESSESPFPTIVTPGNIIKILNSPFLLTWKDWDSFVTKLDRHAKLKPILQKFANTFFPMCESK